MKDLEDYFAAQQKLADEELERSVVLAILDDKNEKPFVETLKQWGIAAFDKIADYTKDLFPDLFPDLPDLKDNLVDAQSLTEAFDATRAIVADIGNGLDRNGELVQNLVDELRSATNELSDAESIIGLQGASLDLRRRTAQGENRLRMDTLALDREVATVIA